MNLSALVLLSATLAAVGCSTATGSSSTLGAADGSTVDGVATLDGTAGDSAVTDTDALGADVAVPDTAMDDTAVDQDLGSPFVDDLGPGVDNSCPSGKKWTSGNKGSTLMYPGKACITCHNQGEGPFFYAAGTVYPVAHAVDSCYGSASVTVELTDANGKVVTATTNAAGNFYIQKSLTMPYTARVIKNGISRDMLSPQKNGDCNTCHTADGATNAPGRIEEPY